ncbi:deoxyguanosinetriphosphate triphosphohydrolase [Paenibacillus agri]|uniref:Deoxyguanosinetriphosphate triphosphohydrolase n=1 Tax=Paenibacillus agri TaxID=2744309 RepID=A0A850ECM1_9BACL|nr:deoxyguanosinetriphosphate triphosphohydrolase [Paenibacillus agri]NUU58955.1 deoxyguanosinetriphosphate triphosphohydrolase [Paenibacillus agri]
MARHMMRWDDLFCDERFREHSVKKSDTDGRNAFENDYSRVVFSSAVRRLQDKAQVFPLDNSDFIRTRLTHSLEVSALGRSIGVSVENDLIKNKPDLFDSRHSGKLGAILSTVGLLHDLGNPPFGHFGEAVIQNYFRQWFKDHPEHGLSEEEQGDLIHFEGNAQSFRLAHKLQYLIDENGFNLTYATLASLLKYPRSSTEGNQKRGSASYKKFGYFQAEKDSFSKIKECTGLGGFRHPIAFLLEAADDIAYSAADIEDGLKKNVLSFDLIKKTLGQHLDFSCEEEKKIYDKLDEYYTTVDTKYGNASEIAIQRFRTTAQGFMIDAVVKTFNEQQGNILEGRFDEDIILASKAKNLRLAFKHLANNYIFMDKSIIMKELVGQQVITGLLNLFVEAVISKDRLKPNTKAGKLYSLISPNYRFIAENYSSRKTADGDPSLYDRLLLVTDFICGMTDSYAFELYQKLTGVRL